MEPDFAKALGQRIRQARLEAGFKRIENLSVALDISHATLARWERGQNEPSFTSLAKVAELTGRPLEFFLVGEKDAA